MAYELKREAEVENLGIISYVAAPFDKSMELFKKENLKLTSARDLAYARIEDAKANGGDAKKSSLCRNGSWVREGVLYVPEGKNKIILLRNSLVLKNPADAVDAHRNNKEYKVSDEVAKNALKKRDKLILKSMDAVPFNRFGEDETIVWLFQDVAEEYGHLLAESIKKDGSMSKYFDGANHIANWGQPYANHAWLGRFDDYSSLIGRDRLLNLGDWARGVHVKKSAKRTHAEKSGSVSHPYTNRKLDSMTRIIQGVKEGKEPASKLEKVIDFLEGIRKD